jgi:cell division septation protein DedD
MKGKPRLFIYDRKEMAVLTLLGVMVALFAFTLGVHLGKRVNPARIATGESHDTLPAGTVTDKVPEPVDLNEQQKNALGAVEDSMRKALHEEVARTGIKLEQPRQVDLPGDTKSRIGGATTDDDAPKTVEKGPKASPEKPQAEDKPKAQVAESDSGGEEPKQPPKVAAREVLKALEKATAADGKFTLQVGSHQNIDEAKEQVAKLESAGLEAFFRTADLKAKGIWHRVYVGGFPTREGAQKAGQSYRDEKKVIDSFVVTRRP